MLSVNVLRRFNNADKKHIRVGALTVALITGVPGYFMYREEKQKQFRRAAAHVRFDNPLQNITPWKVMNLTWMRMPW